MAAELLINLAIISSSTHYITTLAIGGGEDATTGTTQSSNSPALLAAQKKLKLARGELARVRLLHGVADKPFVNIHAVHVKIMGWTKSDGAIYYQIQTSFGSSENADKVIVRRRYTDFTKLHSNLELKGGTGIVFPAPKLWLHSKGALDFRLLLLNSYITKAVFHSTLEWAGRVKKSGSLEEGGLVLDGFLSEFLGAGELDAERLMSLNK